jgi:hypothetical protein
MGILVLAELAKTNMIQFLMWNLMKTTADLQELTLIKSLQKDLEAVSNTPAARFLPIEDQQHLTSMFEKLSIWS